MQETEKLLNAIKELIAIESTADNPAALQAALNYVEQFVRNRVPDITIEHFERSDKPSFLAYRGSNRPERFHIILNGHVDVVPAVPEQFKLQHDGNTLRGRGIYDMKAATLVLAEQFCQSVLRTPFDLGLQIVTDEEANGHNGTLYQIEQGVRANLAICGDCGRLPGTYTIANQAKGVVLVKLALKGRSSHGAYPWRSKNAALLAADFAARLQAHYPQPIEATSNTTVTITNLQTMGGGVSKIPSEASITLDCRYAAGDPHFADKAHFLQLLTQIDPTAMVTEFIAFSAPMFASEDNPLLQQLKSAAETTEDQSFSFTTNNGTGDGRFYTAVGCDACEFGIAGEGQHSTNEFISVTALTTYRETIRLFLEQSSNMASLEPSDRHRTIDLITSV
jgi:succinyl-diaminopimelate desuccinylase